MNLILSAYSFSSDEVDNVISYASRIGAYGKTNGMPALSIEIILDTQTRRFGVIDVNVFFGLGIFHVLYNNDKEHTPEPQLRKLAGEKYADVFLAQQQSI